MNLNVNFNNLPLVALAVYLAIVFNCTLAIYHGCEPHFSNL